jgi:integrase
MAKLKLTEARIRTLHTRLPQEDFFHTPTPGAGLRVTLEGRKTWFLLYYVPGTLRKRRMCFGEHPAGKLGQGRYLTLKEFQQEYTIARADLARGIDPQQKSVAIDPASAKLRGPELLPEELRKIFPEGVVEGTVGALMAEYLEMHAAKELAVRTYANVRQTARAYLSGIFKVPVLQFQEEDVRNLLSGVTKRAPQSVRATKSLLSCAFDYGKAHIHGVKTNPCNGLKVTVKAGKRDRWLTDSEIGKVLEVLPTLSNQKAADIYRLILASMCRPGEAAAIQAEDIVNLNGERVWKLAATKNSLDFLIPLQGPIAEIINRRLLQCGGKGPLFWEKQIGYAPQLQWTNSTLRKRTGLHDIRPHDFRRTGRTHLASLGVPDEVAEAMLNHAKEGITGTYNLYTYWAERKAALALWHQKLANIQAGSISKAA